MVRIPGQPLTCRLDLPGVGPLELHATAAGLARVEFLEGAECEPGSAALRAALHETPRAARRAALPGHRAGDGGGSAPAHLRQAAAELRAWAAGGRDGFQVPLDLAGLPPFARRVLEELRRQPHGTTVSYGALAARCGSPRAARAVGVAMARNPLPIIIPCHRVVAGDGIGGFSPGLAVKRLLWAVEGITR